jgi:hypothetical protein
MRYEKEFRKIEEDERRLEESVEEIKWLMDKLD